MMNEEHGEKVALVTGASKGIGRAICVELAKCGYHIIVNYKSDDEGASQTLDMVKKEGSDGRALRFDVANYDETQNAMDDIKKNYATIDALINHSVGRVLDLFDIDAGILKRWDGRSARPVTPA